MKNSNTASVSATSHKTVIRNSVIDLLESSPAFSNLSPTIRKQIAHDMVKVAAYLTELPKGKDGAGKLVSEVDFPAFVAELVNGVFKAIVDSSISQMEAYAEMIAAVSKSVKQFRDENLTDRQARDLLTEKFPNFFKIDPAKRTRLNLKRKLATNRQQLLATMVLMGINRIVVTGGRIKPAKG